MARSTVLGSALLPVAAALALSATACHAGPGPGAVGRPGEPAPGGGAARRDGEAAREPRPGQALDRLLGEWPARLSLDLRVDADLDDAASFETRAIDGSLLVEIEPSGEARLVLELTERVTTGPALGGLQPGASRRARTLRRVSRGLASRRRDELDVLFSETSVAEAEVEGSTPPPLPEPTTLRAVSTLACVADEVLAFPPATGDRALTDVGGLEPSPLPVLLCLTEEALFPDEREVQVDGAYPFAPAPGVVAAATVFGSERALTVRRGPLPAPP